MSQTKAVPGALAAVALVCALIAGCGEPYTRPTAPTYTVRAGDTVYSIAWRHGLDFRELARWNRLPPNYRINVGQVLVLKPPANQRPPAKARQPVKPPARPAAPAAPEAPVAAWNWPTDGMLSASRSIVPGAQGLLIAGTEGQAIKAAAAGRVVYTGSGLRGMGQLVIIKHTEVYLSAYGLNRELLVKEGDSVRLGQTIAAMGLGPGQKATLYFEIRYNGKPVDPLRYLPARQRLP